MKTLKKRKEKKLAHSAGKALKGSQMLKTKELLQIKGGGEPTDIDKEII